MPRETPKRNTRIVLLSCKHTNVFDAPTPEVGDEVWCRTCSKYSIVEHSADEYWYKCETCGCTRRYGQARVNSELGAVRHRRNRQHHTVSTYLGKQRLHTFMPDRITLADAEIPPF